MAGSRSSCRRRRGGAISGHLPERRRRPRVCRGLGVPPRPDPVAGEPPAGAGRKTPCAQEEGKEKNKGRQLFLGQGKARPSWPARRFKRKRSRPVVLLGPGGQVPVGEAQVGVKEKK
uniref:Uncharacterized protein n=1 Tax=Setaria viridis TaxID=4556 RepID=A0A4U6U2W0_SETVI|nr:hypothetical protein SEVIR_6G129570v2 [Setaria viridis]